MQKKLNQRIREENQKEGGGKLIEMSDPEQLDQFMKEKGKNAKVVNLNFSEEGKVEPKFEDDSSDNF